MSRKAKRKRQALLSLNAIALGFFGIAIFWGIYSWVDKTGTIDFSWDRFSNAQRHMINRCRAKLDYENVAAMHDDLQSQAQAMDAFSEKMFAENRTFEAEGRDLETGEKQKFTFVPYKKVSSAIFVTYSKKTSPLTKHEQVWISKYEYPYFNEKTPKVCMVLEIELDSGSLWALTVETQCRFAIEVLKRYLTASRYLPLKDPSKPNSKLGAHYIMFEPANPANLQLNKDSKKDIINGYMGNFSFYHSEGEYLMNFLMLVDGEAKQFQYTYNKKFSRSIIVMHEVVTYMKEHNREYSVKQVIFAEGKKSSDITNLKNEMTKPAEAMVRMQDKKIHDVVISDERGSTIGALAANTLYDLVKETRDEKCVLYEDEENLIFADAQCDMIRLDAYMWKNGMR